MSPLTLLTATVVVLGLGCWVPTGAFFNARMQKCNRTAMPVLSFNPSKMKGRWYTSHSTVGDDEQFSFDGIKHDIGKSFSFAKFTNGRDTRVFFVTNTTTTSPTDNDCKKMKTLNQIIGNKYTSDFKFPNYYIYHFNKHVLATDYTSTAVVFTELVINGRHDNNNTAIKVFVRNPATKPNADVVDAALHGFCEGDFLNLSSNFYAQIPNDSKLPCFTA